MSKLPLVSVIILNYNGKAFIGECLDSLLRSNYPKFEIIVLDNASTDGSFKYLQKKYGKFKKIKIIKSNCQLYFAGGNNFTAQKAIGEKLIFLNSDTVVEKNWLKELITFAQNHSRFIIQPKILNYWQKDIIDNLGGKYNFFGFGVGRSQNKKDLGQFDKNILVDYANGTCFLIDKKFFEKLGGFDEWYKYHYEDIDLNLRAKKLGGKIWCCPKSIIYHKKSLTIKNNVPKSELIFNIRKNRLQTLIKNFSGWEKILRITGLLFIYVILAIGDLFSFKKERRFLTLKAIIAVINENIKYLVNHQRFRELKKFLKKKKFSLLDIGCGEGIFLKIAQKEKINVLGIDKNINTKIGLQTICSSFENFKTKKRFDVITMFHVLEHSSNPFKFILKASLFLKKDGVLVIETPLIGNFTEKILGKDYFAYQDPTHLNLFTKKSLFNLLNQIGLKIEKRGFTFLEFPLTLFTQSFKKGWRFIFLGIILFLPFKILSLLRINEEIIRIYCRHSQSLPKYFKP